MNPRSPDHRLFFFAIGCLALLSGCTQQNAAHSAPYVTTVAPPPPAVVRPATVAATEAELQPDVRSETNLAPAAVAAMATAHVPPLILSNAPAAPLATDALPPNLRISKPLNEIIQLAQSGLDEVVILTYVTNTTSLFALGAEEIVYLNDLGVSSAVITAMMQRDQTLKTAWAKAGQPAPAVVPATTSETIAAAPTYVNPPPTVTAVETPPTVVSDSYFYETLSPYGSWVEIDGYGRCWRPTVAVTVSDWQPYRDRGRWVYTESGWFWVSDYSWGSVTFHYGRWFSHPRWGWCWWPDNVWAPSWVTWRYDNDHCGWAPLPPRAYFRPGVGFTYYNRNVGIDFDFGLSVGAFTFVPWNRFCDPNPYRHYLPRARSVAIYNQTTVINNVAVGNNNTIVNNGIGRDRVRHFTRTEIKPVQIREERAPAGRLRQEHFERDGRTLVVRRPQITPVAAAPVANPAPERRSPRTDAERFDSDRRAPRSPAIVKTPAPVAPFTPVTPTTPNESAPVSDRARRTDGSDTRERDSRSSVVRIPQERPQSTGPAISQPTPPTSVSLPPRSERNEATSRTIETPVRRPETPTPVRTPTPILQKPVVVQSPAYTPSRQITTGGATPLPAGSTRVDRPVVEQNNPSLNVRSAPPSRSETTRNFTPPATRPTTVVTPAPEIVTPVAPRSQIEAAREQRSVINNNYNVRNSQRVEERGAAPAFTPPAPRSPAMAVPQPTYTPPTPAPRVEVPVTPRVETRSEPRSTPAPRSDNDSRGNSRSQRDR